MRRRPSSPGGPRLETGRTGPVVLIVLKYGGNAMAAADGADPLLDDVAERVRTGDGVVLVHGGGPQIDAELAARNIPTRRVGGLRVTDAAVLGVTEAVLCGTVNKALVRALARRGARAVGISGQDGGLFEARPVALVDGESLGFVGEIARVDPTIVRTLLRAGFVPVIAPLGVDGDGTCYNVNADTVAGALAGALRADVYVVVTNVDRVRRDVADPATAIARLTEAEAHAYLADGTFDGGMRPKMSSALEALARGAAAAIICGGGSRALTRALAGEGTMLLRD